jgi:FtsP/CotA-like multicopper oxidase with cupredoxin domain
MEKRQRMALLGIAALIAVVAIVVAAASGGGGDKASDTTTEPAADSQQQTTTAPEVGSAPVKPPQQPPKPAVVQVRVKGGQPVGGLEKISVKKGDQVEIDVTADAADEAHLHGYDIEKELTPGKKARFRFKADIEGVFELELHHSGAQLARLTVKP